LSGIEKGKPFTETELNRVKSLMKTQGELVNKDAVALGSRLSDILGSNCSYWLCHLLGKI
ncbi:hypothetical protein ECE18_16725, partial [Acinetobacter baumannii]|nr:hypothetical protein [Acinetobacter baumannii]